MARLCLLHCAVQVKNLEWEAEVLQQRFGAVQKERDELYDKFESSVYDVQQKTGEASGLMVGHSSAYAALAQPCHTPCTCCLRIWSTIQR